MFLKGKTKKEIEKDKQRKNAEAAIVELKKYLIETDYIIIKCLEAGKNPGQEYAEISKKRNDARALINKLEKEMQDMEVSQ